MRNFILSLSLGFAIGSAVSIYVTGPERLKAYVWDKFQTHKTRLPISEARSMKAQSNYIEVYTKNVRKKIEGSTVKPAVKKASKKPPKQPKILKAKQKSRARK